VCKTSGCTKTQLTPLYTVYSPYHALHAPQQAIVEGHPFVSEEVPSRVEAILQGIQHTGLGSVIEPEDFGMDPILAVHDGEYIEFLVSAYQQNTAYWGREEPVLPGSVAPRSTLRKPKGFLGQVGYYGFGTGSPILAGTWQAAYWSAQCALSAAHLVRQGEKTAYALCRPPGHHAAADLYGGFCYLNNIAIAARWLGGRAAILDIDYHHGNGTQEIFYQDPTVFFASLHAHPDDDYPFFWGEAGETGAGPGLGYNLNVPLPQGTGDETYLEALESVLKHIVYFRPDWLLVSLGLDIAAGDEVGGFCITPAGFNAIGRCLNTLNLPTVLVQEGGYLLPTMGENAAAFLQPFSGH
jgi:acetoin utilization deacetylase AcuC-like enzyme